MKSSTRAVLCGLSWRYGSDGKVAYLTLKSSASGVELTIRRENFSRLPKSFIARVHSLLQRVNVPKDPLELEGFQGWLKAPFNVSEMSAFKKVYDATMAEATA